MSDYSFSIRLYAQEYYHLSTENNCEGTLFTLLFINFYFEFNRFNIYKMDLDYCGACQKRFRSGDRKRMLSASPDLCKFVFAHALLDISQWIDVTKETNVLLCNSCYLSFYRKMSASIDNEITSMDVGDTGNARFCEVGVQTDPVLVSNCSIQCDDINRHVPTTPPIIDLPTISRHSSDDTIILPLY